MKRLTTILSLLFAVTLIGVAPQSKADDYGYDHEEREHFSKQDHDSADRTRIDRYLDVEIWTNDDDGEYYVGDKIVLKFRANRDAFVAIYTIDTRGRVNLLFPTNRDGENYIRGGTTYRLPDNSDDFDLVVDGPPGVENIQIIASRERFPIPDWYPESGLISDAEDRHDYMDYLNDRYFVRYDGQRFSYDRTAAYVYEWEEEYFRPVYYPDYPSWTVVGNAYIDYPFGSSVYVNGIYWGTTPLYIPRIYVGWHTISIYDSYGYCWESDFHVTRYNTVVFDRRQIHTSPSVKSKYREVRLAGYRDPVRMGYKEYNSRKLQIASSRGMRISSKRDLTKKSFKKTDWSTSTKRKYVRGYASIVQTDRGWEAKGSKRVKGSRKEAVSSGYSRKSKSSSSRSFEGSKKSGRSYKRSESSFSSRKKSTYYEGKSSSKAGSYYQKKSGSSKRSKGNSTYRKSKETKKSSKHSKSYKKSSKKSQKKSSKSSKRSKNSSYNKSSKGKSSSSSVRGRSSGRSSSGKSSAGHSSGGKKSSGGSRKGKGR